MATSSQYGRLLSLGHLCLQQQVCTCQATAKAATPDTIPLARCCFLSVHAADCVARQTLNCSLGAWGVAACAAQLCDILGPRWARPVPLLDLLPRLGPADSHVGHDLVYALQLMAVHSPHNCFHHLQHNTYACQLRCTSAVMPSSSWQPQLQSQTAGVMAGSAGGVAGRGRAVFYQQTVTSC